MLLREIHHRMKDGYSRDALRESESRVHSMALIHELLYLGAKDGTPDLARVDFREYLSRLSSYLMDAYRVEQGRIGIDISGAGVFLDADVAITSGFIVNELVSNSLKHAFPDGRGGTILVEVGAAERGCSVSLYFPLNRS